MLMHSFKTRGARRNAFAAPYSQSILGQKRVLKAPCFVDNKTSLGFPSACGEQILNECSFLSELFLSNYKFLSPLTFFAFHIPGTTWTFHCYRLFKVGFGHPIFTQQHCQQSTVISSLYCSSVGWHQVKNGPCSLCLQLTIFCHCFKYVFFQSNDSSFCSLTFKSN